MTDTITAAPPAAPTLTRKDFVPDVDVRWCPGCGDYSILATVQKLLPTLGIPRERLVFVSGIGCSSRFPYYVNTYGFHTIHGRAPAVATGIKCANPELSVWVATGDGDGLSIGGNHLLHTIRRNVDLKIILFNNRIYGLTKGQASPTSELGKKTKSTPWGTIEAPCNPTSVAIGAEATFVARTTDVEPKHMGMVLERAAAHRGTAFVEVYQNCHIFNDGAFKHLTDRKVRADRILYLEEGKPLIFGAERHQGVRINTVNMSPEVVTLGNGIGPDDLLVHHEHQQSAALAFMLSHIDAPEFPVPMGVFRDVAAPTFDDLMAQQIADARKKLGDGDLEQLLYTGDLWEVRE